MKERVSKGKAVIKSADPVSANHDGKKMMDTGVLGEDRPRWGFSASARTQSQSPEP